MPSLARSAGPFAKHYPSDFLHFTASLRHRFFSLLRDKIYTVIFGFFLLALGPIEARAQDYSWSYTGTTAANLAWGSTTSWTPTAPAGGPDSPGLFVRIGANIGGNRTITLYNTGDSGDAVKTIGRLDVGGTDGSHAYTISAGNNSGVLEFASGSASAAQLNELSTSAGDTIAAPVFLKTSLNISNASVNTLTSSGGISSSATSGTQTISVGSGGVSFTGVIGNGAAGGTIALSQSGGTVTLTAANTYSGGTTVSGGTLIAKGVSAAQSLGGTSGISVSGGGTLLLGASDQINNSAAVNLNGGTIAFDSASARAEGNTSTVGMGALTLSATSTLDFYNGNSSQHLLHFGDSSAATWSGTLSITNYTATGIGTIGSTDRLFFGTSSAALTTAEIADIQFVDPFGSGSGTYAAQILSSGEIVPIPEPSTWAGAALAAAVAGYSFAVRRKHARRAEIG